MKSAGVMNRIAIAFLVLVVLAGLAAPWIAPYDYGRQFRDHANAPAGGGFLMGTDDLGRDRFSRLIYATRVSVLLAPAAALISVVLAVPLSAFPALTTLGLSLPWIFLFIILRAAMPLNTRPFESILLTFLLMGIAGWAWPARIFAASFREIRRSGWLIQARAAGLPASAIARAHVWPHLRGIAGAQFRVLIPAYILSEATLGLLGLGVAEPLPSWGNLLTELLRPAAVAANPWILAPLVLLTMVMIGLEIVA